MFDDHRLVEHSIVWVLSGDRKKREYTEWYSNGRLLELPAQIKHDSLSGSSSSSAAVAVVCVTSCAESEADPADASGFTFV